MARLSVERLTKRFGNVLALDEVTLEIPEGTFATIVGPSGCGKSTLLRLLAGLETPSSGRIVIGTEDMTDRAPERRDVGMMFQSYALFPHMSVRENVRFPLRMKRMGSKDEQMARVEEALELVQLTGMLDRLPRQLSGGQQQRVALARAIIANPRALLLDEPLSNLDAKLREEMQVELIDLHRTLGITTVLVTHDQDEALSLADVVVLMRSGKVEQIGTPEELYGAPATPFAADFMGGANLVEVDVSRVDGAWKASLVASDGIEPFPVEAPPGDQPGVYTLVLRQEDLRLTNEPAACEVAIPVDVGTRVYRGSSVRFVVSMGGERMRVVLGKQDGSSAEHATHVCWARSDAHLLRR